MDQSDYNEAIKDKINRAKSTLFILCVLSSIIYSYLVDAFDEIGRKSMVSSVNMIEHRIDRAVRDFKTYGDYLKTNYALQEGDNCNIVSLKTDAVQDLLNKEKKCNKSLRALRVALYIKLKTMNGAESKKTTVQEKDLYTRSSESLDELALHLRDIRWDLAQYSLSPLDPLSKLVEVPKKNSITVAGITIQHSAGIMALPVIMLLLQIYLLSIAREIALFINVGCEISKYFVFFHQGLLGFGLGIVGVSLPPLGFWAMYHLQFNFNLYPLPIVFVVLSAILALVTGFSFMKARDKVLSSPSINYADYIT